jgi:hypothetical protein
LIEVRFKTSSGVPQIQHLEDRNFGLNFRPDSKVMNLGVDRKITRISSWTKISVTPTLGASYYYAVDLPMFIAVVVETEMLLVEIEMLLVEIEMLLVETEMLLVEPVPVTPVEEIDVLSVFPKRF